MTSKTTEQAAEEILNRSDFEDECTELIRSTESGFYCSPDNIRSCVLIGELYEKQVNIMQSTLSEYKQKVEALSTALDEIASNIEHFHNDDLNTIRHIAVKALTTK